MKRSKASSGQRSCCGMLMLLLAMWFLPSPIPVAAQSKGNNAVWSSTLTGSSAFIDASTFYTGSGPDICQIINKILTSAPGYGTYPATGAVVDARGILPSTIYGPQNCSVNPFSGVGVPSTILLPASNLDMFVSWIIPANTKIIGEGDYTILEPSTTGFTGTDMIDFGSGSGCTTITGVSVEHLKIKQENGSTQVANGIVNWCAQDLSYIDNVTFDPVVSVGLTITSGAYNSGPYSNLKLNSLACTTSCPLAIDVETQTRGLHEITCTGNTVYATEAAIWVNASNNSIEDVHIENFWDGIEIGNTPTAVANVVVASVTGTQSTHNTVHICGPNTNTTDGKCGNASTTSVTVSDVTILQSQILPMFTRASVRDDVTNTTIAASGASFAGMYVLGEGVGPVGSTIGYTRFATSPAASTRTTAVPTWGAGTNTPASQACVIPGALYSYTGTGSSVFVCSTALVWTAIN